jgi:hypothetical protein
MQVFRPFFMPETPIFITNESFLGQKTAAWWCLGPPETCHTPISGGSETGLSGCLILNFLTPGRKAKKDYICTR